MQAAVSVLCFPREWVIVLVPAAERLRQGFTSDLCVCLQPETVAAYLVPRVRTVVARNSLSTYIKYLTIPRALGKFLTAPTKANKYFNKQGMHFVA